MKKLIGIGASVCYLFLVVKFNRVPNCTSLEATCIAASFAGGAAGVMTDPFAMLMMLVCLALGVRMESFLFASAVSTAFSILVAIDAYSYWVEINDISVSEHWLQTLTDIFVRRQHCILDWSRVASPRFEDRHSPLKPFL